MLPVKLNTTFISSSNILLFSFLGLPGTFCNLAELQRCLRPSPFHPPPSRSTRTQPPDHSAELHRSSDIDNSDPSAGPPVMHFPRPQAALLLAFLFSSPALAATIDCEHIRVDDVSFNLKALGGPHSVVTSRWHPPTFTNTSYTVDICKPLKRKGDVKKDEQCPNGTRGTLPACSFTKPGHLMDY